MLEELADHCGIEVGDVELVWLLADMVSGVAQEQSPGVTVGGHGVGAGLSLPDEPLGEVGLQGGGEGGHDRALSARSSRWEANSSSSGTAERYQNVFCGLECPR